MSSEDDQDNEGWSGPVPLRAYDDDDCPDCDGEGGFHACGEDSCCCADKDEITDICQTCGGTGVLSDNDEKKPK